MNKHSPLVRFTLGDQAQTVSASPSRRLSEVLREDLGLKSVKIGCDAGDCGACTVLVDGEQHCACLTMAGQVSGRKIETVETSGREIANLQKSFLAHGAAQCGICIPGMLMAGAELLRRSPKPAVREVEDALGGVLCRCTGYSKIIDAVVNAHAVAQPSSPPAAGASIGARIPRLDGAPKVDGSEVFGADHRPNGSLLVLAVRSPHFHALFEIGDTGKWRPAGVDAVITAADIGGENCFGVIPPLADQPALAEGVARFLGEAVALIVGDPAVVEGLDLNTFPISWTPLPYEITQAEAGAPGAPQLHDHRPDNTLIRGRVASGDPDEALGKSAFSVTVSVETSYVEHAYIEPEAGAAWMDDDVLVIQACTQAPIMDRDDTAKVLGLPQDRVRIIPAAAGGGFGAKLDLSVQPLLGLAVLKTGQPCHMVWSRTESMLASTKRHPGSLTATIGADADGRIMAMKVHGEFNTGAYSSWGPTVATRVPVHASGPYLTPNYLATSRAVHSNGPSAGAFRGFGVPQAAIAQETLYDELAEVCGKDRLEFRRHNALKDGDATPCGQVLQGVGIADCLDALKPDWERALHEAEAHNAADPVKRRGVGIASCWYGCGNTALPNPSTIRLGLTTEGALRLHQGATDIGQGSNTVITQIAADALGLPVDQFELIGPDTFLTPDCGKTSASRQTYITGKAAELSGRSLRSAILRMTNAGDGARIALIGGKVVVEDGETSEIDLASLPLDERGYALSAEETYDPPTTALDENGQGTPYAVYGYGAQIAELEVDMKLGTTKVLGITAAHDLGKVINPLLAEGQIEGGIAQGLGLALMEEFLPGRTNNLHDYLIPTIGDMPAIKSILIEKPDPEGPMGAKGLGEHVLIPTAPAILNAIRHATGAKVTKVPALPHRVLAAIKARAEVGQS